MAFRGQDEDHFEIESEISARRGNFLFLLQFRVDAGDEVLKQHLLTAGPNALYTNKINLFLFVKKLSAINY